jgi:hypothetical protein
MAVNMTHPDYDGAALEWARARDVLAGEDALNRNDAVEPFISGLETGFMRSKSQLHGS